MSKNVNAMNCFIISASFFAGGFPLEEGFDEVVNSVVAEMVEEGTEEVALVGGGIVDFPFGMHSVNLSNAVERCLSPLATKSFRNDFNSMKIYISFIFPSMITWIWIEELLKSTWVHFVEGPFLTNIFTFIQQIINKNVIWIWNGISRQWSKIRSDAIIQIIVDWLAKNWLGKNEGQSGQNKIEFVHFYNWEYEF
jgi:hypothetical protein